VVTFEKFREAQPATPRGHDANAAQVESHEARRANGVARCVRNDREWKKKKGWDGSD
jgi:hypothetical protein